MWTFGAETTDVKHTAPFPIELPSRFITLYTSPDETLFEPYGGSGTTMVACEQLARQCRMIEIEPKYCEVVLQRMQDMGLAPYKQPESE
jgi:DNA modification methylase